MLIVVSEKGTIDVIELLTFKSVQRMDTGVPGQRV
jgi:hypothetical protein